MKHYLLRRFAMLLLVLFGVSILSFALIGLFGRDPAEVIARHTNIHATYEQIEAVRVSMGLDKPLPVRYLTWITGLLRGNVGTSIYSFMPIMEDIGRYFPVSLALVGMAMLWVVLLAVPISLLCARFSGSAVDHVVRFGSIVGLSFPTFWLGFLLLISFAVKRAVFTVVPAPGIKGYILPSFALAVPVIAGFIRVFRASLLKETSSDYAVFARARGLARGRVLISHAIVILDEATASVDADNESHIQAAISELVRGKTLLMIAHRLKTIRNADQIVILDGGRISSGTHEELLESSEKYSSFIKLREEAARWKMQSA